MMTARQRKARPTMTPRNLPGMAVLGAGLLALGACTEPTGGTGGAPAAGFMTVPESVVAIAAPHQPLDAVRIQSDGCFWYRHEGPVETTMLPLRTREGNPICTRDQTTPL